MLTLDGHMKRLSMLPARHLAIALVALAVTGCAQERPLPLRAPAARRPVQLIERVGQKVTLRGRFSLRGKHDPFVLVGKDQVYLIPDMRNTGTFTWSEPYASMDNREVIVTGVLKRYEPSLPAVPVPVTVQQSPPYFFLELRDTTIFLAR
jgi:hypothetical protein